MIFVVEEEALWFDFDVLLHEGVLGDVNEYNILRVVIEEAKSVRNFRTVLCLFILNNGF